ncbi:MAG: DUF1476 domain-containing protein [Rhodospirillales bacterium]|nr:DUF1476 domain-containing protein [Rhodospirillales bacterium]
MSNSFQNREKSFEAKQKLDAELQFRAEARRDKLVGLWAAAKMGIEGSDAEAYAKSVAVADMDEPGIDDVIRKIMADFNARGVKVSEDEVRTEMERQMIVAIEQVKETFEPLGDDHN